jgi:hypothetical protein
VLSGSLAMRCCAAASPGMKSVTGVRSARKDGGL